jgi:hypothetical protein
MKPIHRATKFVAPINALNISKDESLLDLKKVDLVWSLKLQCAVFTLRWFGGSEKTDDKLDNENKERLKAKSCPRVADWCERRQMFELRLVKQLFRFLQDLLIQSCLIVYCIRSNQSVMEQNF